MAVVVLFCTVVLVAIGQDWEDCNIKGLLTKCGAKELTQLSTLEIWEWHDSISTNGANRPT